MTDDEQEMKPNASSLHEPMTGSQAGWSDVERLLARTIGDLVALEETVRALGRRPERLAAMREELERMDQQVQARRRTG